MALTIDDLIKAKDKINTKNNPEDFRLVYSKDTIKFLLENNFAYIDSQGNYRDKQKGILIIEI